MSEADSPVRRRRLAAVAAGGVLVAAAAGAVLIADADAPPETVASFDADSATTTTAAPTTTEQTTTTTAPTTTSAPPATLPAEPLLSEPVAPPLDPRGAEENPPLGRIAIPRVGLDAQLEVGIRLTTLDRGPGHWPGTARPGEVGNVVVAAHRTSHGAEFRDIDQLVPGDEVRFTTDTGEHLYRVTGTQIVGPDALWIVDQTAMPTATLFACHPLGSTAQRIVVNLELAS